MYPTAVVAMAVVVLQVNLCENSGPISNTALETIHAIWGHGRLCFSYRAPTVQRTARMGFECAKTQYHLVCFLEPVITYLGEWLMPKGSGKGMATPVVSWDSPGRNTV